MLEKLGEKPIVGDVRGAGYFMSLELVKDKETQQTFDEEESEYLLRGFLSRRLYEAGLICRADDRGDPVVQLSPPLSQPATTSTTSTTCSTGAGRGLGRDAPAPQPAGRARLRPEGRVVLNVADILAIASSSCAWPAAPAPCTPVRWVHTSELDDPTPGCAAASCC